VPEKKPRDCPKTLVDRLLCLFGEVRAGEAVTVLLMSANVFILLLGYYVLKTVREPLILNTGGAEMKAYSSAGQALLLMGFIPLYSWLAGRVERLKLIVAFNLFFFACIELFYLAGRASVPYTGIAFFVWVGIFSNAVIAQFWSYANDIYPRATGERLFPIIMIGMTLGSWAGSKLAARLFEEGVHPFPMLHLGALALGVSLLLYWLVDRREAGHAEAREASAEAGVPQGQDSGRNGFALVFANRYLLLIALTLVLANWVNTIGEYLLDRLILAHAQTLAEAQRDAFVGAFRGNFYFWVNVLTTLIQALLVSRIVRRLGIGGVLFALPLVALGAYGLIGAGVGFAVTRWAKTAENATDYSIMNTAKALLWLPTTREEKYKAKQTTDTFFVRLGDMGQAGTVYLGTAVLGLSIAGFAGINLVLILFWLMLSYRLLRRYQALVAARPPEA
jgi:AAA family ATP:ADP antiporter